MGIPVSFTKRRHDLVSTWSGCRQHTARFAVSQSPPDRGTRRTPACAARGVLHRHRRILRSVAREDQIALWRPIRLRAYVDRIHQRLPHDHGGHVDDKHDSEANWILRWAGPWRRVFPGRAVQPWGRTARALHVDRWPPADSCRAAYTTPAKRD